MQCANPKVFRLTSKESDKRFTLFIPCGKCYACQCASRAEWALRFKAEFADKRNLCEFNQICFAYVSSYKGEQSKNLRLCSALTQKYSV